MSDLKPATQALQFISCLYDFEKTSPKDIISILGEGLEDPIIFSHEFFPMKEYYSKEMGESLKRCFFFYPKTCTRESLIDLKLHCDAIEKANASNGQRVFNLDPGIITLDQVLLSSGKPYSHRIYLRDGVYAELTYQFSAKSFHVLPWTYPDYQNPEIVEKFNWFRAFLL